MKRLLISASLLAAALSINAQSGFISDTQYRAQMEQTFAQRVKTIGKSFYNTKKEKLTGDEREALEFLYAYMPLADLTDYPTSFFADNVRLAFQARHEMPWGKDVPELLFRHFVLPIRVNNEPLDAARGVFYNELKDRVKSLSMHDAILEVNHWCHEKVTYQPADARTSSPLQTLRTATGRCGEQSTFAVAALRAVGIPARQVYTPRWAHTDDNHAWVEAWADGKWYFLGACEPEPVLNLGWFNAPASRGMLMHTRAFGDYRGPEEVLLHTNNFTEINLTSNYAPTAQVGFTVTDRDGKPVENARVDFKIYNYAEFYTAVTKYTDKNGNVTLSAGLGDLLIWASKDGKYGYRKASFGKDKNVNITLNRDAATDKRQLVAPEETLDIVPPAENVQMPYVSDEMRQENNRRFAHEDSIRKAYTATFLTKEQAEKINPRASEYLVKSRGNKQTIIDFLARHKDNEARALGILATLSDKDLRDIPTDILEDNFTAATDQLSPRVEDEMITLPFKNYFQKAFKKTAAKFADDPNTLVAWINKNIRLTPDKNALRIAQTPVGVMESRMTDGRSRDIFFVDVARSLGIEARKDAVTGKVQYKKDGAWHDVNFEAAEQVSAPTGKLVLTYKPDMFLDDPKYYSHFTVSKIVDGVPQLMNFEEGQADMGNGTCWSNTFKQGAAFDTGTYMLTTGTRLANGSVLATTRVFNIEEGKTTTLPLDIRHDADDVSVIGQFNSESTITKDGKDVSILSQTGRGYYIIAVLGVGQEPTNHALHDIEKEKAAFEQWGRPVVLLFESEADARKFHKNDEFGNLPSTVQYAIDKDNNVRKQIVSEMKMQSKTQLPVFIIADTFNRVVFSSQGYTIGLGEQMKNVFKKLQ